MLIRGPGSHPGFLLVKMSMPPHPTLAGGQTRETSVFPMLNLRRRPDRTCKIRSPSRMRPSLAAMLFGLICEGREDRSTGEVNAPVLKLGGRGRHTARGLTLLTLSLSRR